MNLSKNILSLLILLTLGSFASGQAYLEGYLSPGFSYRAISGAAPDSTEFDDQQRLMLSFGFNIGVDLSKDVRLITGFGLSQKGYTGVKRDMQFLDSLHPSIGRIEDLSETILSKDAFFRHTFRYLQVPLLIDYNIGSKYKRGSNRIGVIFGLSGEVLLNHQTDIFLKGFSVAGDNEHRLLPSDFQVRDYNVNVHFGSKIGIMLQENIWFQVQPMIQFPFLTSANFQNTDMRFFQANIQTGISYTF